MTYQLELMRDNPLGIWIYGQVGTATDYANRRPNLTTSGTTTNYLPLFNGTDWSLVPSSSAEVRFQYGQQYRDAYSIETFASIITPGSATIIGHKDAADGLILDGTIIRFITRFESEGYTEATYDLKYAQNFHVAGVYDGGKNSLFINGVLVAESDVSVEQYYDGPDTEEDSFYSVGGSGKVAIAGTAVYHHPLTRNSIRRHYLAGIQSLSNEDVSARFSGYRVPLWSSELVPVAKYDWSGDSLTDAASTGFVLEDSVLVPEVSAGVTTGSSWKSAVWIEDSISRPVTVIMDADTTGVDIEYSVDGTVWVAINGPTKETVTDEDSVIIQFRAEVQAGLDPEGIEMSSLVVTVLDADVIEDGSREIVNGGSAINQEDRQQNQLHEVDGISLSPGYVAIDSGEHPTRTIEIFARNMSSSNQTLIDTRAIGQTTLPRVTSSGLSYSAVGSVYVNGQPYSGAFTWPVGEWKLIHIVLTSDLATTINVGKAYDSSSHGSFQIGNIVLYPDALSAGTIEDVFSLYFGNKAYRLSSGGTIVVAEPTESVSPYSYDWSIQTAG